MDRKSLAFDLEIAKVLPDGEGDLKAHRPLGITCAATLTQEDGVVPKLWYSQDPGNSPALQMNRGDLQALVAYLTQMASSGYTIITWNGLNFDFDILAEESGLVAECQSLAWEHVDMMFDFFCRRGFMAGLDSVARGLGLPGKTEGMNGAMAPKLWAEGRHQEVLEYVAQDVVTTLQVALAAEKIGEVRWTTRRGSPSAQTITGGWLPVEKAYVLPLPDVSWMDHPMSRSHFTEWLLKQERRSGFLKALKALFG